MDWLDDIFERQIRALRKPANTAWGSGLLAEASARLLEIGLTGGSFSIPLSFHAFLWGVILTGLVISFAPRLHSAIRNRNALVRIGEIRGRTVLAEGCRDFMNSNSSWIEVFLPLVFARSSEKVTIRVRTKTPKGTPVEHEKINLSEQLQDSRVDLPLVYINVRNSNPSAWVVSEKSSLSRTSEITFLIDVFDHSHKRQKIVRRLRFIRQTGDIWGHPDDHSLVNIDPWIVTL